MRKDVKFGLTIGAILLATLAVYVIVLSRGGAGSPVNPDVATATPSGSSDSTPSSDNLALPPADKTAGDSANPAGDAVNTLDKPAPAGSGATATPPATEPSASADTSSDWNYMLNHGQVKQLAAAAPERTVTPTIDRAFASNRVNTISIDAHPALIDAPTTEPASLSAPVIEPTVAQANASAAISAQPLPSPLPTATVGGKRTHTVVRGETLSSIAASIYGNSKYYTKIEAANPGLDARRLKIGATIIIPDLTDSDRTIASAATSDAAAPVVDPARGYTVVAGDTLEKISVKLYGSAQMVEKIYDVNRARIGPDENRLTIGWVLKLPQPPTNSNSVTASARQ
jgi:nucleoid-associated protein YgaU